MVATSMLYQCGAMLNDVNWLLNWRTGGILALQRSMEQIGLQSIRIALSEHRGQVP